MTETRCPTCGRESEAVEREAVDASLERLEPYALAVYEDQLSSLDERVRANAAKMLLEWQRGKPKQQIAQTTDMITTIRYESAAWQPDEITTSSVPAEITVGG